MPAYLSKESVMYKRSSFLLIFLIASGMGLYAQKEGKSFLDGSSWISLSAGEKVLLLKGANEGCVSFYMSIGLTCSDAKRIFDRIEKSPYYIDVSGAPFGQISEGIDELYKDYANKHVPALALGTLVAKRIRGKLNEQEFSNGLQNLRSTKWQF
jgi:hypothetical protein